MSCSCLPKIHSLFSRKRRGTQPHIANPSAAEEEAVRVVSSSTPSLRRGAPRSSEKSLANPSLSAPSSQPPRSSGRTLAASEKYGESIRSINSYGAFKDGLPKSIPQNNSNQTNLKNSANESFTTEHPKSLHPLRPTSASSFQPDNAKIVDESHTFQGGFLTSPRTSLGTSDYLFDEDRKEFKGESHSLQGDNSEGTSAVIIPGLPGSAPNFRLNGGLSREPNQDAASSLIDRLIEAQLESPKENNQYFIPADELDKLITLASIEQELKGCRSSAVCANIQYHADRILKTAPKLFAILVLCQSAESIINFLDEGLIDNDLPFVRLKKSEPMTDFKLCSRRQQKSIQCMGSWKRRHIQNFSQVQWRVLSPIFPGSPEIRHYKLHDNCVLPFITDKERSGQAKVGGFGTVWEIVVHHAHQFLLKNSNSSNQYPSFALKRLHSNLRRHFDMEVEMLKALSQHRHPHLVKLLATFEYQGAYYLLFPWAKANLRTYWKGTPLPQFSTDTVMWLLRQCKGIASGLLRIHGYQTTHDYTTEQSLARRGRSTSDISIDGRLYGRHGDIKPENILWTDEDIMDEERRPCEEGLLLLADFGLMRIHRELTKSLVNPESVTGSPTYEPPELKLHAKVSRAYDIWSLGCVYLEFLTWLIGGWDELDRFSPARSITGLDGTNDDTFFTLVDVEGSSHRTAVVRGSVQQWINDLDEKPECSDFIHEFLHLISTEMLIIDPQARIHCGHLNERLSDMLRRAKADPEYLTRRTPSDINSAPVSAFSGYRKRPSLPTSREEGFPLPRRAATARSSAAAARMQPQSPASIGWQYTSAPSSPKP